MAEPGRRDPERGSRNTCVVEHCTLQLLVDQRPGHIGRVVAEPEALGEERGIHDVVVDEGHHACRVQIGEFPCPVIYVSAPSVDNRTEAREQAEDLIGKG